MTFDTCRRTAIALSTACLLTTSLAHAEEIFTETLPFPNGLLVRSHTLAQWQWLQRYDCDAAQQLNDRAWQMQQAGQNAGIAWQQHAYAASACEAMKQAVSSIQQTIAAREVAQQTAPPAPQISEPPTPYTDYSNRGFDPQKVHGLKVGIASIIGTYWLILFIAYWLPTVLAFMLRKQDRWGVVLLNLLFGWSGIGWIIALVWAAVGRRRAAA